MEDILPENIAERIQELQMPNTYGVRIYAVGQLAKLDISYPSVVSALLAVAASDPSMPVQEAAKIALTSAGHQEVLTQYPDLPAQFPNQEAIPIVKSELLQVQEPIPYVTTERTKKCPYCAETIKEAAIACHFCGRSLSPPRENISSIPMAEPERPGCVTTYVVLMWLGIVVLGIGGVLLMSEMGFGIGMVAIGLAVVNIFIAQGLWRMRNWARVVVIIMQVLSILSGLASFFTNTGESGICGGLVGIGISGYVIYWFATHEADFR